ncbi:MAG: ABC transporter transmembrane domain-containing protein, partial [Pseudomonadota bacterium]
MSLLIAREDALQNLQHLIAAGGWRSNSDAVFEAFPHVSETLTPAEIIETLQTLRIPHTQTECRLAEITRDECPALVFPADGGCFVLLGREGEDLVVADLATGGTALRPATRLRALLVRIERFRYQHASTTSASVWGCFSLFAPMLPWLLIASLLTNVLGLMAPLLIMAIYDRVIPANSVDLLTALVIGVGILLASDFGFRCVRTQAIAHAGRHGERDLTVALFRKLMSLPLSQLQKSDIDQQLARFRQFEALREIFTGQVLTTLLDLPFALIFLAVLFVLAPPVGLLTIGVILIFVILSLVTFPIQQRLDKAAADASTATRAVFHDAVGHQGTIANLGIEDRFAQRAGPLIDAAEQATQKARLFQSNVTSMAQTITSLATVFAIVLSAHGAITGTMTFGALIAVIALVSKVLAPIHALNANLPQILAFRQSRSQADRVL